MSDSKVSPGSKVSARQINDTIRYTMWSVFSAAPVPRDPGAAERLATEVEGVFEGLTAKDLVVRGSYDVAGLRAEADIMFWWHGPAIEVVQEAYHQLRRTELGSHLTPVWSNVALHRPAEFNRGHVPDFMSGAEAKRYVCVYPFVRSYDWYLLPDDERRKMLVDHGMKAREYPDVRANTVASFGLGDYEWILAFEADDLHRIVDLMREMRATEARRHVREEIPFYTGPRVALTELVQSLA